MFRGTTGSIKGFVISGRNVYFGKMFLMNEAGHEEGETQKETKREIVARFKLLKTSFLQCLNDTTEKDIPYLI